MTWPDEVPPTLSGAAGRGWLCDMSSYKHARPDTQATIAMWVLNIPGAHPLWSWWGMAMIHLRPIAGVKPPCIDMPGATHELIILALQPNEPVPDPRGPDFNFAILTPMDVAEQVKLETDAQAEELCTAAARACCEGRLSPDQDFRSAWHNALHHSAEHIRSGLHGRPA